MKIVEVRHPLVQHKIGLMRNAALSTKDFRELANELGTLLAYEATADLETEPHTLPGWAGPVTVQRIAGAKITVVPILRAGLGMLSGVLSLIPAARVSVVGLQRDEETLQPVPYFERLTGRLEERDALILDPRARAASRASSWSPHRKASMRSRPRTRTWRSTPRPSMPSSTTRATSCRAWAMRATAFSVPAWCDPVEGI